MMGWCSGTQVFDDIAKHILDSDLCPSEQYEVMRIVAWALEDNDWDCQMDSRYFSHKVVQRVMKTLHPDWIWGE